MARAGFNVDLAETFCRGERTTVAGQLISLGWQVSMSLTAELWRSYGLELSGAALPSDDVVFLDAALR